jgi:large conductance mechanosensitive channel
VIDEFKEFINKGSVIDLAVAVVLGAAFTPVINSIVDRVLMPVIGLVFNSPNFDTVGLFACDTAADAEGLINGCAGSIGAVLTAIVNFLLVGLALFFVVKAYNRLNREEPVEEPEPEGEPQDIVLLREIRDALSKRSATTSTTKVVRRDTSG